MSPAFAANLRYYRQSRGLTQHALANVAGCSQALISALERGLRPDNSTGLVVRLARALHVTIADLNDGASMAAAAPVIRPQPDDAALAAAR